MILRNLASRMKRESFQPDIHFEAWAAHCEHSLWLDRFCSSPYWGVPLCEAFQRNGKLVCYRPDASNMALFLERAVEGGVVLMPPDGMWMLGTPVVGDSPIRCLQSLLGYWRANPSPHGLRQVVISGLYPNNPLLRTQFWKKLGGWEIESSGRMAASLADGVDGFMSRRSKNFRSRLRRTLKASAAQGDQVEYFPSNMTPTDVDSALNRLFAVEAQCWKGLVGNGINTGSMRMFYECMLPRLAADGRLRGLFLTREGEDIAYLFGAAFAGGFRGLQFSFRESESIGLGNVCQYHMISALVEEGCVQYDLGQAMDYKKRWAEQHIESRSFVFQF